MHILSIFDRSINKTVMQLSEYLRAQDPTLRGYSRRNIYNMVLLYDTYSSFQFVEFQEKLKLNEFVQPAAELIVQAVPAQFPSFLELTTLSNHFETLNACKTVELQRNAALNCHFIKLPVVRCM